jgi:CRISPR-associated endonuclease Csn1
MKKILGLDLGTNSIGWALIEQDVENKQGKILGMGSRIIPMSQDILGDFGKGNSVSQTAQRTRFRSVRRLRERHLLRRERLHRVLNLLGFLPEHYAKQIDFAKRLGQYISEAEPKLAYKDSIFIFQTSFLEMLEDFKLHQPGLVKDENGKAKLVPYDWTIYYLRKKALTQKIEKEELAWLILNFNQKRGYYQLRGEEEEENPNKLIELYTLKIVDVKADERLKGKDDIWYSLILENGWIYRRSSKIPLFDWKDKIRDFIVTTDLNDDGTVKTDKEGKEKRSFKAPGEEDWTLRKKKTEQFIYSSGKTVGTYIYDTLLQNPKQKIRGKLVRTIERHFYKDELTAILSSQKEFHPEFKNEDLFNNCIKELYRNNEVHRFTLSKRDLCHLFLTDIIFYQRPLKSNKSSISNCPLEYRKYRVSKELEVISPLKVIPKSHPLFQEFRLWQWISNLSIYRNDNDDNVTQQFISNPHDYQSLFDFLFSRKEISQESILKYLLEKAGLKGKALTVEVGKYRWNYIADKPYPCNETRAKIVSRLSKVEGITEDFLTSKVETQLWHIIYSVTDKTEYEKALNSFARKHNLAIDSFVGAFRKFPPFSAEYGSYSAKAIKKLLPLMRMGTYWNSEYFSVQTKDRVNKIITGEYDETIKDRVREKSLHLTHLEDFQKLPLWLASYVVYDRHSEAAMAQKWKSPQDVDEYLKNFRQHSLRNPIVEQVMTETLRVVRDIWLQYGNGAQDFFNEIHVELGRDMKNTADDRKKITEQTTENENTNLRIKALLIEMMNDNHVENVRPYSPMQQELLKIYEDGALSFNEEIPEDIEKIRKKSEPSKGELQRYKLWLEQRYRSPYTGQAIPLNRLFTPEYEIEHIIPQSRYFDDSFSNKVICEAAVNKLKDNQTGLEFVKNHHGETVELGGSRNLRILDETGYMDFVNEHYAKNRSKRSRLLMEDLPEEMIKRQLNDTRYISKFISSVLSNIVRSEDKDDMVNSKNLIPGNGKITAELRQDWGLNDIWNELILPRFERMNSITGTSDFTTYNENHHKFLPTVPFALSKGFQKKRIDHRHHALDALVIACASRSHINYLNNQHALDKTKSNRAKQESREDLRAVLCNKKYQEGSDKNYKWQFKKPWDNFTVDARESLEKIIVSFKQNLRVINKTTNKPKKWVEKDGQLVQSAILQPQGESWAIRKPMHKDTVSGMVRLRKVKTVSLSVALDAIEDLVHKGLRQHILMLQKSGYDKSKLVKHFKELNTIWQDEDISRVNIYNWDRENVASRVSLDTTFDLKKIESSITDSGIQKILIHHLGKYVGRTDQKGKEVAPELLAFSPEGIEDMNLNMTRLNGGKFHQPIFKVRTYEPKGNKFGVGQTGNKRDKYVEAAKGTNLFFAIYQDEKGKRNYETIPLNIVIERQKQGLSSVPEANCKGQSLIFYLSPTDLVYLPSKEEIESMAPINFRNLTSNQLKRIYKVTDVSETTCNFIPAIVSNLIFDHPKKDQEKAGLNYPIQNEFGLGSPQSKNQRSIDNLMIKETCIKINVDRLGTINPYNKNRNLASGNNSYMSMDSHTHDYQVSNLKDRESNYDTNIRFFQSFEEAEDFESRTIAFQDPIHRIHDTVALILRAYGITREQLNERFRDNKIHFTSSK